MILWPHKFTNVTNGVTPRRWLAYSNPALTELLNEHVGYDWVSDMNILSKLEEKQYDPELNRRIRRDKIIR